MALGHRIGAQQEEVERAALRSITASYYGKADDPNFDAEQEYAGEQLALAARALVRAVDALPPDQQPVGWGELTAHDGIELDPRSCGPACPYEIDRGLT
jgi:hypothetical protein